MKKSKGFRGLQLKRGLKSWLIFTALMLVFVRSYTWQEQQSLKIQEKALLPQTTELWTEL